MSRKASVTALHNPVNRQPMWHVVDATGHVCGRLATQTATLLMGKHKPIFSPGLDVGDHVVIVNAQNVQFVGKKWITKVYRWHSGWPGGLKERTALHMLKHKPEHILQHAVAGMLAPNKLKKYWLERLKIYTGPLHPHLAQVAAYGSNYEFHKKKWHELQELKTDGGYDAGLMRDGYLMGVERLNEEQDMLVIEALGKEKERAQLLGRKSWVKKIPYGDYPRLERISKYYPKEWRHPHQEREPFDEHENTPVE
eukprot:TRINITY_DN2711_c0_g1_i1.p1 TRINITY_DN2711_c0_g1~~TRINITY_DN2711_c0_g1_i1.p1  ORF type:complete len:253 (+),score=38.13 TRINITY_DN2711_c0_g1_i1:100-858(+)